MFMDLEKRAKRQSLKIIVSEFVMVVTVIITVTVLAFVVSGYWLNADFKVERQGMLQINSVPTGATVAVDGDSPWFQRTNTSKILSSGKHEVVLSKEGYDTWSKTVDIKEGLLYRLNYPHLFLENRTKESVYDTTTATFATVSPNRILLLLANNTTSWTLINLDSETIKPTIVDVSKVFPSTTSLFNDEILSASWDSANEHVLFKLQKEGSVGWVLLDVRDPSKSLDLTREFATSFMDVKIMDHSADNLLAIRDGNLHKIDVGARHISAVLVEGILDYDFYDSEIIYTTEDQVSLLKLGQESPLVIKEIENGARVLISKFYDDKYFYIIEGEEITVYQKSDFQELMNAEIGFVPQELKIGYEGDFVSMNTGSNFATLDMESMQITKWQTCSDNFGWLNGYMVYAINDGELSVYDFDGLNHRTLSSNVSNHFPVVITSEKWLYYFSDDELVREWLIAR